MAQLFNNGIKTGTGLHIEENTPTDDRLRVETFSDLATIDYKYNTMIVRVMDEGYETSDGFSVGVDYIYNSSNNTWKLANLDLIDRIEPVYNFKYPSEYVFRPFDIYELNDKFYPSFDIKDLVKDKINTIKPYYVDFELGSNSNNGSDNFPYKTIFYALQQGAKLIYLKEGVHQGSTFGSLNNSTYGSDDKFIIAKNPSKTFITNNIESLVWTLSSGIYSAPISTNIVGGVADLAFKNEYGLPSTLLAKTNITDVQNNSGSYFYDSANSLVYINTLDNRNPDSKIFVLATNISKVFSTAASEYLYMEGITFMGGVNAFTFSVQNNPSLGNALVNNCKFLYARDNGFRVINTGGVVWSNNCIFYDNGRDGANYTQSSTVTSQKIIETNNEGWDNGVRRVTPTEYAMNGSSVHDNITVLRINSKYWGNYGPNVNDVNGSMSLNIGVECFDSKGNNSSGNFVVQNGDFSTSTNQTSPPSKMWLYGCKSKDKFRSFSTARYMNNNTSLPQTAQMYVDKSTYVAPFINNVNITEFVTGTATSFDFPPLSSYTYYNPLDSKQDTLVSGSNIKTVNGNSLLGSGDIVIATGGGTWGGITGTLSDQTDLQNELDLKVSLIGDETIGGVKTFSFRPTINGAPITSTLAASPVAVKNFWYGTQSQYDALGTYSADTEYNIEVTPTILSGSATLDFLNTSAGMSSELTITVTGAADGDVAVVSPPNGSSLPNSCFTARVSAPNTVSIKFNNYSTLPLNPASGVFKVKVFK